MPRLQSKGHTATLRRLDLAEHMTVHVQDLNRMAGHHRRPSMRVAGLPTL
jgi:hypothetical protein